MSIGLSVRSQVSTTGMRAARSLRRTSVGPFTLAEAVPLEDVSPEVVRPMIEAVRHLDACTVGSEVAADVAVGKVMARTTLGLDAAAAGPWAVVGPDGALLAVYESFRGDTVKPSLVIPGA